MRRQYILTELRKGSRTAETLAAASGAAMESVYQILAELEADGIVDLYAVQGRPAMWYRIDTPEAARL